MASNAVIETVPLDRIDLQDKRYKISTGGPSGPLAASIKRVGILSPPVLIPAPQDRYTIVSGFKRIAVLKQLGLTQTTASVLERNTAPRRCIEIAFLDNTAQRQLNAVEQGRVVLLLDSVFPNNNSLCKAAEGLGLSINARIAHMLRTAARMRAFLQDALIRGEIALPVALQLADMEDQDSAKLLADLIGEMGLGLNRQRELLDWIKAILRREQITIPELLADRRIKEWIGDSEMDRKQKSRLLRQHFKQRRFPELVESENRFYDVVRSLQLGDGIRLEPPQNFEGQAYRLTIHFKNQPQLIERYQRLDKSIRSNAMTSLWDYLKET